MRLIYLAVLFCIILPLSAVAQNVMIKGTITSEKKPMEGVVIKLEGANTGTVTDNHGHYILDKITKLPAHLTISMIGFKTIDYTLENAPHSTQTIDFEMEQDALNLSQVVITGTRSQIRQYNSPVIVNTLSNKTFEATQSLTLSEGLSFTPGLRLENNCQNCGFTQLRMNGLDGSYSQILINSRPVFSALAGVYGLDMLPTSIVDRVEIIRGGGSALYGGNAIAGTVNIITKDPVDNSFNIGMNQSLTAFKVPDRTLTVNGTLVSDDLNSGMALYGYTRTRAPWDANADGFSEMTKLANNTFGFDAFYNFNSRTKLKGGAYTIREFRRGGNDFDLPPHQSDITEQLDHKILGLNISLEHYSPNYKHKFSIYASSQKVDRDSYYGGGGRILEPEDSLTLDDIRAINAYGNSNDLSIAGGVQYVYEYSENAIWTSGIETQFNTVTDVMPGYRRTIDQQVRTIGNYTQLQWKPIDKWTLLLGGRLDNISVKGIYNLENENLTDSKNLNAFVPRISAMYAASADLKARVSFAQGYRAPQAFDEDLHIETIGGAARFIVLSPDLVTEKSNSFTSSLNYSKTKGGRQINLVLEGFYTILSDPFILSDQKEIPSGVSVITKRNGQGAFVRGLNLEANFAFTSRLIVISGLTLQTAQYDVAEVIWSPTGTDDTEISLTTRKLLRTPDTYGFFNITYKPIEKISLSYSGIYTGKMLVPHVIDSETEQTILKSTPAFLENNIKISFDLPSKKAYKIQLFTGVQNIFNSFQNDFDIGKNRDSAYIYGPMRPRTLFFGMSTGFN